MTEQLVRLSGTDIIRANNIIRQRGFSPKEVIVEFAAGKLIIYDTKGNIKIELEKYKRSIWKKEWIW